MGAATILWTIGPSSRTLNACLNLLRAHQIEVIADVRCFPGSRRSPHFREQALAGELTRIDV